jgi:hypothetical protein
MTYDCRGADEASQAILDGLGASSTPPVPPPNHLDIDVVLTNDAVPSPAQGASFVLPMRWTVALPASVTGPASRLGIKTIDVSNIELVSGVTSGATGADITGQPSNLTVDLGVTAGFNAGPFNGTFTRSGAIGTPIVVAAKAIELTATVNLGNPLVIALICDPPAASTYSLVDATGTAPPPTTPSSVLAAGAPAPVPAGASATAVPLATTGGSMWVQLAVAVALLDLGYLAVSATWTHVRRRFP